MESPSKRVLGRVGAAPNVLQRDQVDYRSGLQVIDRLHRALSHVEISGLLAHVPLISYSAGG
jgi:hypothetical protein